MDTNKLQRLVKMLPKGLPPGTTPVENITKVTFTTESGKSFTIVGARAWQIKQFGNIIYQIHGFNEDLNELLKDDVPAEKQEEGNNS